MPRPPAHDAPAALREAYAARFGPLVRERQVDDTRGAFITIASFWDALAIRPFAAYASLDATSASPGRELLLVAAAPYGRFLDAIESLLGRGLPLRPLSALTHAVPDTLYTSLFLVPVAEAEAALGMAGGPPGDVLLAVPITEPEERLAASDPRELLDRLSAAGALVAAPIRACTVAPDALQFEREQSLISTEGRRFHQALGRLDQLEAMHPPEDLIADDRLLVAERRALLHYLDSGRSGIEPAREGDPPRHVPFALHRAAPPSAERVARRALVLASLAHRGRIEREAGAKAEKRRRDLVGWLAELGLDAEMEARETEVLGRPVGALSAGLVEGLSWIGEGVVVLAWALGRAELPAHDERAPQESITGAVGLLDEEARKLLASPELRPAAELGSYLDRAYAIAWRSVRFRVEGKPLDFARLGREERFWFGRLALEGLPLAEDDLVVGGAPLRAATREALQRFETTALERMRAATWLAGVHPTYSRTPALP